MTWVKVSVGSVDNTEVTEKSFRGSRKGNLEMLMNTEYVKFTESARKVGAHPDTFRYWVKLIGAETIKRGHCCYITTETLGVLMVMAQLIAEGMPAGEAAEKAKATAPVDTMPLVVRDVGEGSRKPDEISARLEGLEKAMLAMADVFKTEISTLRGEVIRLTEANHALKAQIEAPPKRNEPLLEILNQPPKPVAVWTPPTRKDPLESAGLLEKAWAYFMEPERMRSHCAP